MSSSGSLYFVSPLYSQAFTSQLLCTSPFSLTLAQFSSWLVSASFKRAPAFLPFFLLVEILLQRKKEITFCFSRCLSFPSINYGCLCSLEQNCVHAQTPLKRKEPVFFSFSTPFVGLIVSFNRLHALLQTNVSIGLSVDRILFCMPLPSVNNDFEITVPAYPHADMGFEQVCPRWSSCSERPLLIPILFRLSSSCSCVLRGLLLLFALISFLMMKGLQTFSLAPFSITPTIYENEQCYRTVKRPCFSILNHFHLHLTFTD